MKNQFTNILLVFAAVFCFTVSASAQKDKDKRGDKRKPPVIVPDKNRQPKKDKGKKSPFVTRVIQARAGVKI